MVRVVLSMGEGVQRGGGRGGVGVGVGTKEDELFQASFTL